MTEPTTTWRTGSDHGLVWGWGLALVSEELELDQVTDLWQTLSAGSDLGLFLQTLGIATGRSVLNLPDFAVAVFAPMSRMSRCVDGSSSCSTSPATRSPSRAVR